YPFLHQFTFFGIHFHLSNFLFCYTNINHIGGGNMEHYILSDGFKIPKVGFGTAGFKGKNGARRIEMALNNGYRLIDSAYNYENEGAVGYAVRNSGIPRNQITVTSKLPGRHHAYED